MKNVIIIEDQTAICDLLAQLFENNPGYKVVAQTGDGHEGLKLCLEYKPDFIILDVILPGLNGLDVLKKLSSQLPNLKVLTFSGNLNPTVVRQMLEAGANGFVEKTASLSELKKGIDAVAEGGNYFGPQVAALMREAMVNPQKTSKHGFNSLTTRERETLQLIAESYSTKEVASKLEISVKTAENHRTNLMRKLDLHDTASLTRCAIEHGLVNMTPPFVTTNTEEMAKSPSPPPADKEQAQNN